MSKQIKEGYENLPVQLDKLIEKSSAYTKISTRAADPQEKFGELKIFTEDTLNEISENMEEFNEKVNAFGRQNSFHTNKLMTLQMLSKGSPYRVVRQCLSQIERKRGDIKENIQNLKKKKLDAEDLLNKINDIDEDINLYSQKLERYKHDEKYIQDMDELDVNENIRKLERGIRDLKVEKQRKEVELEELEAGTADMRVYLEGAFKEIASFQQAYYQVKENWNISDDWSERDFEDYEPRFHVRHVFMDAFRETISNGKIGMGTTEHSIQIGINLIQLESEVQQFISNMKGKIYSRGQDENGNPVVQVTDNATYDEMEEWLKMMEEKYKDSYKDAMKFLGLDSIYEDKHIYKGDKKEIEE